MELSNYSYGLFTLGRGVLFTPQQRHRMKRSLIWDEVCLKSSSHIQADEKSGKDFSTNSYWSLCLCQIHINACLLRWTQFLFLSYDIYQISKRCCWIMSAMTPMSGQKRTLMNSYINIHKMGSAQTEYIRSTNFGHWVINPFK